MFIFPEYSIDKLEFEFILQQLCSFSRSKPALQKLEHPDFSKSKHIIEKELNQVIEIKHYLLKGHQFNILDFNDLSELLSGIAFEGFFPLQEDIFELLLFLENYYAIVEQTNKHRDSLPLIFEFLNSVPFNLKILSIVSIFETDGSIKDNTTVLLSKLRKSIKSLEHEIDIEFNKAISIGKSNNWLSDEEQSMRSGARVIAVQSKFKRKFNGVVLNESGSGKTTFIQPAIVLEIINKINNLKNEERAEIRHILREIAVKLHPFIYELKAYYDNAIAIDVLCAKASFSIKINACKPVITDFPHIEIYSGRHPVLFLNNKLKKKSTVPLDLSLNIENRIMVISGPNAGGKTVCLKTIGLFLLMLQAAIPVPCEPQSSFYLFNSLFTDIGDNQSLENDLSTYSGKLLIIKYLLEKADENTLFLIDEFGSGTEPQTGGIVAEVVLQHLLKTKAFGIISTHYSNLKLFASENKGVVNGAMLFDKVTLTPVYRLQTGIPGSSYTLEMIQNTGMTESFMDALKIRLCDQAPSFERILSELNDVKNKLAQQTVLLNKKLEDAEKRLFSYKKQHEELILQKKLILHRAKENAVHYLENIENEFNNLLKKAKNLKNTEQTIVSVKETLEKIKLRSGQVKEEIKKNKKITEKPTLKELKKGDWAKIAGSSESGIIVEIKNKIAFLQFDVHRMQISIDKLEPAEAVVKQSSSKKILINQTVNEPFSATLDVRGMRKSEAINATEIFINQAVIRNYKDLKIIHGRGNGILKEAIRSFLKQFTFVIKIENELAELGGDGATLIKLD